MSTSVVDQGLNPVELRSGALSDFMPIYCYLFSAAGRLLYANKKASCKLQSFGEQPRSNMQCVSICSA